MWREALREEVTLDDQVSCICSIFGKYGLLIHAMVYELICLCTYVVDVDCDQVFIKCFWVR